MSRDTSAIDAAVVGRLLADSALMAAMPGGVYFDVAADGKTQYVLVSHVDASDDHYFENERDEHIVYAIKAVELSTTGSNVGTAARRIDALFDGADFAITGYNLHSSQREKPLRYTEVDDVDRSKRWQHRGGHYEVVAQPLP